MSQPDNDSESPRLMILPSRSADGSLLLRVPADFTDAEAYRAVTGIVAEASQTHEELADLLEERGFHREAFLLGPALD